MNLLPFHAGDITKIDIHSNKSGSTSLSARCLQAAISQCPGEAATIRFEGYIVDDELQKKKMPEMPEMERVIFNPPATVVIWKDGDKTVVKCDEGDIYNKCYGLMLCWLKKLLGGTSRGLNDALRTIRAEAEKPVEKKEDEPAYKHPERANKKNLELMVELAGLDRPDTSGCPLTRPVCAGCPADGTPYPDCAKLLRKAFQDAGVTGK